MFLRLVSDNLQKNNQVFSTFSVDSANLATIVFISCCVLGFATLITFVAFSSPLLNKDNIFKKIGFVVLVASITAISGVIVVDVDEKNDSIESLAVADAEEKLDSMLKEKYGFSLLDTKVMGTRTSKDAKVKEVTLTKNPIEGTTADGGSIQISIKVTDEGKDLIAYSYGAELTPLAEK